MEDVRKGKRKKQTRGGGSSVDGPVVAPLKEREREINCQKLQRHVLQDPDVVTPQHTPSPIVLMSTEHNLRDGLLCIEGITALLDSTCVRTIVHGASLFCFPG